MYTVEPELVGFSPARLERLTTFMQDAIEAGLFPGVSVMVARHGRLAYCRSLGVRDVAAKLPMQLDTICRIYSMTKPITSVALMMLYEEGYFNLYDPVSRYIPAFGNLKVWTENGLVEMEREPTIRDLLTHTAGLSYGTHDTPVDQLYKQADFWTGDPTPDQWIHRLMTLPLAYQPGARWQYSCATDVCGYLVQVFSGCSFDQFLEERIFRPLGMIDTAFYVPEEKRDRFARLYLATPRGRFRETPSIIGLTYTREHTILSGGGGLVSTMLDYSRFAQLLANGGALDGVRLLSRKTLNLMRMNHLPGALLPFREGLTTFHGYGFGLGFAVLIDLAAAQTPGSVGCYGWSGAASTDFWVDPQEDLWAMMMPQVMPQPYGPVAREFRRMVYQALAD